MDFFRSSLTSKEKLRKKYGLSNPQLTCVELDLAYEYIKKTTQRVEGFEARLFFKFLIKQAIRDQHVETLLLLSSSEVFRKKSMAWFKLALELRKDTVVTLFIYEVSTDLQKVIRCLVRRDKLQLLKIAVDLTRIRAFDYTASIIEAIDQEKEQILTILLSNPDIGTSECLEIAVRKGNRNMIDNLLLHANLCPNYDNHAAYNLCILQANYAVAISIAKHHGFHVTSDQIEEALKLEIVDLFEVLLSKNPSFNPKIVKRAISSQNINMIHVVNQHYAQMCEPMIVIICKYDFFPALDSLIERASVPIDLALTAACRHGALACIQFLLSHPECKPELNIDIVPEQFSLLNTEVIRLLDADGRVNLESAGEVLFTEACKKAKSEIIRILISRMKPIPTIKIDYDDSEAISPRLLLDCTRPRALSM